MIVGVGNEDFDELINLYYFLNNIILIFIELLKAIIIKK